MSGTPLSDPGDLDLRWRALARPSGDRLSAERVRDWAGGPVLVAVDSDGERHLLVRLIDGQQIRLPRPVAGLTINVRRLHPAGQPDSMWVDLAASDPNGARPFSGLAADIVAELPGGGLPEPAVLLSVIERWRRFWAGTRDGLSREEQLGLLGELWLLLEWLPQVSAGAVNSWVGPLGGRHDFVTESLSVEVKTSGATVGPVVHRISRLDQLDEPSAGELLLLSLRAVPDPLSTDSLDSMLARARQAAGAAGQTCVAMLDDRLRALGIVRADEGRYVEPVRIAQQELFRVSGDFPRLAPASFPHGLPAGVVDLTYSLDTSACRPWMIAAAPEPKMFEALID